LRIFVEYALERKIEEKKGKFERLQIIGLILKITAILSFLLLFVSKWYAFVPAGILLADIPVEILKSKSLYTVTYRWENHVFTVKKTALSGKQTVLERLTAEEIEKTEYDVISPSGVKYYSEDEKTEDKPIRIVGKGRDFTVLGDLYLYAILENARKQEK